jgi:hypothetical protein
LRQPAAAIHEIADFPARLADMAARLWNGEAIGPPGETRPVFELFNLLDTRVSDIESFYASRLHGGPSEVLEMSIRRVGVVVTE